MDSRIGDTPLIGCGTWTDNETCGVSGTGYGEVSDINYELIEWVRILVITFHFPKSLSSVTELCEMFHHE